MQYAPPQNKIKPQVPFDPNQYQTDGNMGFSAPKTDPAGRLLPSTFNTGTPTTKQPGGGFSLAPNVPVGIGQLPAITPSPFQTGGNMGISQPRTDPAGRLLPSTFDTGSPTTKQPGSFSLAPNDSGTAPVGYSGQTTPAGGGRETWFSAPPRPGMPPQSGVTTSTGGVPQPSALFSGATGNVTGVTNIVPGQSLIGTQINPTTGQRTQGVMGQADAARDAYANYQHAQFNPVTANTGQSDELYKELLGLARSGGGASAGGGGGGMMPAEVSAFMKSIQQGPDRAKLAADAYDLMLERSQPEFAQRERALGQKTAALGRVGSGMYGSNLVDLNAERERELGLNRRELASQAAGQSLDDRLKILDRMGAVGGAYAAAGSRAADRAAEAERERFGNLLTLTRDIYGRESDQFGRGVSERDAALGYDTNMFGRRRTQFGDLAGEEDRLRTWDRRDRDELRGERGYQTDLEDAAIRRRIDQRMTEEGLLGDAERRRLAEINTLGPSFGGSPADMMAGIGGQEAAAGNEATGGAMDWLSQWLLAQQLNRQRGGGNMDPNRS